MLEEEQFALEEPSEKEKDPSPSIEKIAFSCPHCGAYTHQFWFYLYPKRTENDSPPEIRIPDYKNVIKEAELPPERKAALQKFCEKYETGNVFFENSTDSLYQATRVYNLNLSCCYTCKEISVWVHDRLLFPPKKMGPEPNKDLPKSIKATYEEARSILHLSPRGTAALLRLCIQNLCIHLGKDGKNLNKDIASLVAGGLDVRVQKALDIVRVIGNNAVHPGQIELKDNLETAIQLFKLVNLITDKMISEPKTLNEMYGSLPLGDRDAIDRRDQKGQ
ncbi:MAG TPA: hypothetical protein DD706_16015 [Nitrospiraceae bacterium]|nr:hypothetical protein [Nitrospiraceae bacterium]